MSDDTGFSSWLDFDKFDLTGIIEVGDYDYSWSVLGVWYHEPTKTYRVAEDAGCSCNSSWDDFRDLSDFGNPLTSGEAIKKIQDSTESDVAKIRAIEALRAFNGGLKPGVSK